MTHYLAECDAYSLEIAVPEGADLDGTFEAVDLDDGETVRINGWLWTFEPLGAEAA